LTDVCPGTCNSGATPLAFVSGFLLFLASDGDRQHELWRTDGVPGHERLVKEFCPGLCSLAVEDSLVWNGNVWLIVQQPGSAPTLWRSDATPGGTEQMADLCADLEVCNFGQGSAWFAGVTAGGDALLLIAGTDRADILLRTDGTRQGTTRLHRNPNLEITSNRTQTAVLQGAGIASEPQGALYFVDGSQLWISDGTVEGTRFVRDLATLVPVAATDLQTWRTFDGIFYAITGQGVWLRSDGTSSGTVLLGNLSTIFAAAICRLGSTIYAVADDGLWTTGASPQVPQLIAPLSLDYFEQVVEQPDRIYIENLADVYLSDGTTAGTHRLRMAENAADEYTLTPLFDGASFASGLNTLWRIDGDSDSIGLLRDFEPANGSAGPYGQAVLNDRLIFFAFTEIGSLFASDGTEAGTGVVSAAVNAFGFDRNDQPFSRIGAHLFFPAVPGQSQTR
jgi:ELWxxDGT repeat protein